MLEVSGEFPPERPNGPDQPPSLSGRQRILVDALERKSQNATIAIGMYLEAMRALRRMDSLEAHHVAAYELREFMNSLPRVLDLPVVQFDQIMNRIRTFIDRWGTATKASACLKDGKWDGQIDDQLRRALTSTREFVEWVEHQVPTRRIETSAVLRKLFPSERPMPTALLDIRVNEWSDLLRYFNNVAHHDSRPDVVEFDRRVQSLEEFLLDLLAPRTFEDQDEIDRLIRETEAP